MKDKILLFYLFIIITGISTLTVMANSGRIFYMDGSKSIDEGLEHVEDTLILDSLEMNSAELQTMYSTEAEKGDIYYDDSFVNIENDEALKEASKSTFETKSDNLLSGLKKKDERWHISDHTIKKGESIWTIARDYDTDHRLIISYNNIERPDHVKPGSKIGVPNKRGLYYTVKKGDTLSEIAHSKKIASSLLQKQNGIPSSGTIKIGQKLFLPDAKKPVVPKKQTPLNSINHDSTNIAQDSTPKNTKKKSSGLDFDWPVSGHITSAFGMRNHPITGKRQFHNGIDIRAAMGTNIKAAESGTVIYSGWKDGYGWMVVVKHPKNYITVYAHLSKRLKKRNDIVKKGDVVGKSGSSGVSTGPHLHFEIRKYETPLDPLRML